MSEGSHAECLRRALNDPIARANPRLMARLQAMAEQERAGVRVAQIWVSRVEPDREFFVQAVTDAGVRGMDYRAHKSATRTKTIRVQEFTAEYALKEDTPAHILAGVSRD